MSNEAINWAYRQDGLSCGAKFVLVALADFADHEWSCFPSQERLAHMTGQSVRSVHNHLKTLTEAGYVTREPRRGASGQRTSDRYYLQPANLAGSRNQPADLTEPTGKSGTNQPATVAEEPLENPQEPKSDLRPDVEGLLDHLEDRIADNGAKVPGRTKAARDAARLMLDSDGRNLQHAHALIDWATRDEFWRSNILSMSKFRQQYDRLAMRANLRTSPVVERPSAPVPMPDVDPDDVEAWVAAMEARRG